MKSNTYTYINVYSVQNHVDLKMEIINEHSTDTYLICLYVYKAQGETLRSLKSPLVVPLT